MLATKNRIVEHILCMCVCVCVCVLKYVFMNLHITAQSGPVLPRVNGGINDIFVCACVCALYLASVAPCRRGQ